jgi:DNA-binding response OmpR family regulator
MATSIKKILIVEDEKPLSHALELKLRNEGYEPEVVTNGHDALEALDREHYGVMLLDMMMPVMDGFQVLEQIQKIEHAPVVFVLSNLSLHDDKERVIKLGAKDFFVKSEISLAEVVEHIKSVI